MTQVQRKKSEKIDGSIDDPIRQRKNARRVIRRSLGHKEKIIPLIERVFKSFPNKIANPKKPTLKLVQLFEIVCIF